MIPLEYISVPKYGYQAFIINEYDGLDLECMHAKTAAELCSPLEDFNPPQTLNECVYILLGIVGITHTLAYFCLLSKSRNEE